MSLLINLFWERKLAKNQTYGFGCNYNYVPYQIGNLNAFNSSQLLFGKSANAISKGRHYQYYSKAMDDKIFSKYHVLNNRTFNPLEAHQYLSFNCNKAFRTTLIAIRSLLKAHSLFHLHNNSQLSSSSVAIGVMTIKCFTPSKMKHDKLRGLIFPEIIKLLQINKDVEKSDYVFDTNLETVQTKGGGVFQHTHIVYDYNHDKDVLEYIKKIIHKHNGDYDIFHDKLKQVNLDKHLSKRIVIISASMAGKALSLLKYKHSPFSIGKLLGSEQNTSLLTLAIFLSYIYKQFKLPVAYNKYGKKRRKMDRGQHARNTYYRWHIMPRPLQHKWIKALLNSEYRARLQLRPNVNHYKSLVRHAKLYRYNHQPSTKIKEAKAQSQAMARRRITNRIKRNQKLVRRIKSHDDLVKINQWRYTVLSLNYVPVQYYWDSNLICYDLEKECKYRNKGYKVTTVQNHIKRNKRLLQYNLIYYYQDEDKKIKSILSQDYYSTKDYHWLMNRFHFIYRNLEVEVINHKLSSKVIDKITAQIQSKYPLAHPISSIRPVKFTHQLNHHQTQSVILANDNFISEIPFSFKVQSKLSPNIARVTITNNNYNLSNVHRTVIIVLVTPKDSNHDVHFLFLTNDDELSSIISPIVKLGLFRYKPHRQLKLI